MMGNLATRAEIAELNAFRRHAKEGRESKAPKNSGLTKEQTQEALKSLPKSGQKIPEKLIPKLPT